MTVTYAEAMRAVTLLVRDFYTGGSERTGDAILAALHAENERLRTCSVIESMLANVNVDSFVRDKECEIAALRAENERLRARITNQRQEIANVHEQRAEMARLLVLGLAANPEKITVERFPGGNIAAIAESVSECARAMRRCAAKALEGE